MSPTPHRPPRLATAIVSWTSPADERDAILGDLAEEYDAIAHEAGPRAARRWYLRQMALSALPNLRRGWRQRRPTTSGFIRSRSVPMNSLLQDVQFGWRMLHRRPLLASIAILSLVVGMSATTVVFSLLNAIAFQSLPLQAPEQLRLVLERRETGLNHNFSFVDYTQFGAEQRAFSELTAYSPAQVILGGRDGSQLIRGELVTGTFFPVLGVRMRIGRGLSPDDDRPGSAPAVVVSDDLWRQLRGDSDSLDREPIFLNDRAFSVVGVAAPPFRGMQIGRDSRFWAPLRYQVILAPMDGLDLLARPGASWLTVMGRLNPGVDDEQARAELDRMERSLPRTPQRNRERTFTVTPGRQGDSMLPAAMASPLQLLLAAAGLVLAVACANVAGLLVARASERDRELALRTALGASRMRLARLLLVEAAWLGLGATLIALFISSVAAELAVPLLARFGEPIVLDVHPDWRVLAFAAAIGVIATTLFGLVPVAATTKREIAPALAEAGRGSSASRGRAFIRRALVVSQFALSLALVLAAMLLGRTLHNLRTLRTGFDIDRIAVLAVDPEAAQLTPARTHEYFEAAADRLRRVPGVVAVGLARVEPLDFGGSRRSITIPQYTPGANEDMEINYNRVSADYFAAMALGAIDGRVFDQSDVAGAPTAMVVNETMARRFWPGQRAVGRQVQLSDTDSATVVGVVPDVKYRMLRESPGPSFYLSAAQRSLPAGTFHVRTGVPPQGVLEQLRRALAEVDSRVPITRVRTLREQADINVNDDRLAVTIAFWLAAAALLLAAVGLYGAMSHAVSQRTREIGVRMALGAVPMDLQRLMLRQGVALALVGSFFGSALGFVLARSIENRLFGVAAGDPLTFVAAIALLAGVAVAASWLPARRAAGVDPVEALRMD